MTPIEDRPKPAHNGLGAAGESEPHPMEEIRDTVETRRLRASWEAARDRKDREGTTAADAAEQAAYDELVDWVEANDLNGTEHDPRGPLEGDA